MARTRTNRETNEDTGANINGVEVADGEPMTNTDVADERDLDLAAVLAERDSYLDQFQRARADYMNLKRRVDQEQAAYRLRANRDLLTQLLPVVDDFRRAMAAAPEDNETQTWISGTQMVERKLLGILERYGVVRLDSVGQSFDPARHEAIATEPGSSGSVVTEVYQEGYLLGEELLRPAMVKTGDPEPTEDDE